jgi:hypothetical protein
MGYLYEACDQTSDLCHQQLLRIVWRKISWTDGRMKGRRTDRGKTVYTPPPSGSGGIERGSFKPFVLIRKKLVMFVHFKGFNISQKPKPLSYFAQDKFKFGAKLISDNSYVSGPERFLFLYFKYWYFRSLKRFWDCDFNFVNVLELHQSMEKR